MGYSNHSWDWRTTREENRQSMWDSISVFHLKMRMRSFWIVFCLKWNFNFLLNSVDPFPLYLQLLWNCQRMNAVRNGFTFIPFWSPSHSPFSPVIVSWICSRFFFLQSLASPVCPSKSWWWSRGSLSSCPGICLFSCHFLSGYFCPAATNVLEFPPQKFTVLVIPSSCSLLILQNERESYGKDSWVRIKAGAKALGTKRGMSDWSYIISSFSSVFSENGICSLSFRDHHLILKQQEGGSWSFIRVHYLYLTSVSLLRI